MLLLAERFGFFFFFFFGVMIGVSEKGSQNLFNGTNVES